MVARVYKHRPHKFCCERRERTLVSRDFVSALFTFFCPVLLYIVSLLLLLFSIIVVLLLVPRVYKHWPHKFCCERRERTLVSRDFVLIIITIIFCTSIINIC